MVGKELFKYILSVFCAGDREVEVTYRDMAAGDEEETSALILRSFRKYIAHTYTTEGLREFLKETTPEAIAARKDQDQLIILAFAGKAIVGVIAVRNKNHISLLFVDESRHRKGTARRLVSMALARVRTSDPSLRDFTVNSSPFAVKFYEKLGFQPVGPERVMRGMRITPMRLALTG
jgi:GNAT superfamily N-acetyltransferase